MGYLYLGIAIIAEVVGTTALKASDSFTRLWPSVIVVVGYGVAFYFMSMCMRFIAVGPIYAMWSGLGIVLITAASALLYKQVPDVGAVIGIGLIVAGVVVLNLFSRMSAH